MGDDIYGRKIFPELAKQIDAYCIVLDATNLSSVEYGGLGCLLEIFQMGKLTSNALAPLDPYLVK